MFRNIRNDAPLMVVEAVWQYSHHVLPGLLHTRGPILTVANWSGQWPGLVGMLNLNGSLTKAGVKYSTLWSDDFTDELLQRRLASMARRQACCGMMTSHVQRFSDMKAAQGRAGKPVGNWRSSSDKNKAIMGVFDEGCMGMYNAIIPDELLHPTGIYKERLSQSMLYAAMQRVSAEEAQAVREWLDRKGMRFETGTDPANELTEPQILEQCRMYIAALRLADDFGCDTDRHSVSAGAEGPCARVRPRRRYAEQCRPAAGVRRTAGVLYEGAALPHFNEVDECAGLDAPGDKPGMAQAGFSAREDTARRPLGRRLQRRVRLGV